jgi:hypothetical protein
MKTLPPTKLVAVWLFSLAAAFATGYQINSFLVDETTASTPAGGDLNAKTVSPTYNSKEKKPVGEQDEQLDNQEPLLELMSVKSLEEVFYKLLGSSVEDPKRTDKLLDTLEVLAAKDPLSALRLAQEITSLSERERAKRNVLEVWAQNAPFEALAWANDSLADETEQTRSSYLQAIYSGFAETNPSAAFQAASQLPQGSPSEERIRQRILGDIIETQIENGGLQQAKATVDSLPDGDQKTYLMRNLINEWAGYDPENAAKYVNSLSGDIDDRIKVTLAEQWAAKDPMAAAQWVSQLNPDDPAIPRAASEIIQEWARYDLYASAEWLNSLPSSPELDRAVASYTYQAAQEDPQSAMSWAESISSDWLRTRMMERVAAEWKSTDTAQFESYLQSSGLTLEQQQQLLQAENRGGDRWFGGGNRRR